MNVIFGVIDVIILTIVNFFYTICIEFEKKRYTRRDVHLLKGL